MRYQLISFALAALFAGASATDNCNNARAFSPKINYEAGIAAS